jgi:hypothetical protein
MSPKTKVIASIVALVAAYCASVGLDAYRLTSSEIYPLARKSVAAYLVATKAGGSRDVFHLKWWSSWYFRNNSYDGRAEFFMCADRKDCHKVVAYRDNGRWSINVDGLYVNTGKWRYRSNGDLINVEIPRENREANPPQ